METRYRIVGRTDGYHARTSPELGNRCEAVLEDGLSLGDARRILLDMYNRKYEDERPYAPNWGMAVLNGRRRVCGATATFSDGTRMFSYDVYSYSIEECPDDGE